VASDIGGLPEVVGEACGILVPPENPEEFARAIVDLATKPVPLREMGAAGRPRAEHMISLDPMPDGVEAVYRAVLQRKSRPLPPPATVERLRPGP
jgi:glycosyltransferase involved in cell wall biosynthesis